MCMALAVPAPHEPFPPPRSASSEFPAEALAAPILSLFSRSLQPEGARSRVRDNSRVLREGIGAEVSAERILKRFISDTHLGAVWTHAHHLLDFLIHYEESVLVIVGDFIDIQALEGRIRYRMIRPRIPWFGLGLLALTGAGAILGWHVLGTAIIGAAVIVLVSSVLIILRAWERLRPKIRFMLGAAAGAAIVTAAVTVGLSVQVLLGTWTWALAASMILVSLTALLGFWRGTGRWTLALIIPSLFFALPLFVSIALSWRWLSWKPREAFRIPDAHQAAIEAIIEKARSGVRIVLVPGNHDAWLRQFIGWPIQTIKAFMADAGIQISTLEAALPRATTMDGRRALISQLANLKAREMAGMTLVRLMEAGLELHRYYHVALADGMIVHARHGDDDDGIRRSDAGDDRPDGEDEANRVYAVGSYAYDASLVTNYIVNLIRVYLGLPHYPLSQMLKSWVKSAQNHIFNFAAAAGRAALNHDPRTGALLAGHIHKAEIRDIAIDGDAAPVERPSTVWAWSRLAGREVISLVRHPRLAHAHAPMTGRTLRYLNPGDWVESLTGIIEPPKGGVDSLRLIHWPQIRHPDIQGEVRRLLARAA